MERQTRLGCSVGSMLGATVLSFVLSSSTLLAQMRGKWVGTTARGEHMEFQVNSDDTVSNYQSDSLITCESGGQYRGGFGAFVPVPIVEGHFDGGFPPREPGSFAIAFEGAFFSQTEAAGSHTLVLAALRPLEEGVTSQICRDDAEWSAVWEGSATAPGSTGLPLSPGDQVMTYSDGNFSFQFVSKAVAPK